jgi:hypothetical protein
VTATHLQAASQCCLQGVAAAMAYAKSMVTLDRPDLGGPCNSILRVLAFSLAFSLLAVPCLDAAAAARKSDGGYCLVTGVIVEPFAAVRMRRLSGVDGSPLSTTKKPIAAMVAIVMYYVVTSAPLKEKEGSRYRF